MVNACSSIMSFLVTTHLPSFNFFGYSSIALIFQNFATPLLGIGYGVVVKSDLPEQCSKKASTSSIFTLVKSYSWEFVLYFLSRLVWLTLLTI
jgi:hypothetical protein